MNPYSVSAPTKLVVDTYAAWKNFSEESVRNIMNDGWTLPSLSFSRLYEARSAALDLAMVSGSVNPFQPHNILITEYRPGSAA